ncbi:MAG: hypothetical protein GY720_14690 [bacterium]|nr:hypothetical protein [bacterium]
MMRRWLSLVGILSAFVLFTPGLGAAQIQIEIGDSCVQITHFPGNPINDAPSRTDIYFTVTPMYGGSSVHAAIGGASGPQTGEGMVDSSGIGSVGLPLFAFGEHTIGDIELTMNGATSSIDPMAIGGGIFVVNDNEPRCDTTTLILVPPPPSTTSPPATTSTTTTTTTTTAAPTVSTNAPEATTSAPSAASTTTPPTTTAPAGGGGGGLPIWLPIGGILILVGGGLIIVGRGGKDCSELLRKWQEAQALCDTATETLAQAEENLQTAKDGFRDAEEQFRDQDRKADEDRAQLATLQRAQRSSIESGGITFHRIPEGLLTSDGLQSIIDSLEAKIRSHDEAVQSWKDSMEQWQKRVEQQQASVDEARARMKELCQAAKAAEKAYLDCIGGTDEAEAPAPPVEPTPPEPTPPTQPGGGTPTPPTPPAGPSGPSGPGIAQPPQTNTPRVCKEGDTDTTERGQKAFIVPATRSSLVISIEPPTGAFAEWLATEMSAAGGWLSPNHLNDEGFASEVQNVLRDLDNDLAVSHEVRIEVPRQEITYKCVDHLVCRGNAWVKSHSELVEVGRKPLSPVRFTESGKTSSRRVAQMIRQAQSAYQRLVREDESISSWCQ